MIKKILIVITNISFILLVFAQVPAIQWQKSLGGSNEDSCISIQQTTDGGYITVGRSYSNDGNVTGHHGNYDYWIVKLTNNGGIQWQKSLGGNGSDEAISIRQTLDGGYIVAGKSFSSNGDVTENFGNSDCWIVKLTSSGVLQWQKSFGGSNTEAANSVKEDSNGGYIIAGYSFSNDGDLTTNRGKSDVWILRISSTGSILWQKSLGGSDNDSANSIQQTSDGGYIVAGYSKSNNGDIAGNHGDYDAWVIKLANDGTVQWQKSIGDTGYDNAYSIQQTLDGGYIIAGETKTEDGYVGDDYRSYDFWVVKLNSIGVIEWQKKLGAFGNDSANAIHQTIDGGYIIAGYSEFNTGDITGNHGNYDFWVVKLNSTGIFQWQKSLGGSSIDSAKSIQQTSDAGYIVAGSSESKNGDVTGNHGGKDYWIVKLTPDDYLSIQEASVTDAIIIENPVKNILNIQSKEKIISLRLYNLEGKLIKASNSQNMNVAELGKEVYILKIQLENGDAISKKIIKD